MISDILLAKLCAAAYLPNAYSAIAELGLTPVWQTADPLCSAIVARDPATGETVFSFEGTQIDLMHLGTVFDDIRCAPVAGPGGVMVARGFYEPFAAAWATLVQFATDYSQITFIGHSLGGAHASAGQLLVPSARVVTFGSPALFHSPYTAQQKRYVRGRDPVPDLPVGFSHAGPMNWLNGGADVLCDGRPFGLDLSIADHLIDGDIAAMSALA